MMVIEQKKVQTAVTSLAPRIIRQEGGSETSNGRTINSKELFTDGSQSILIEHEGTIYCLRATKFGKLLITK
ncbi:hemin uptake protein HemP [Polynucleobacter yangtzensis]|jgi:hemin uptake protein HemP|uniref:hemin uptake protein HemP n=1 Tax=Polynucleobacter yangtzensis TaxID=1743159 RepID=UPI00082FB10D